MNAVSIQRALQMSPPALLAFVKTNRLSLDELALVIDDLAAAKRSLGRTRRQGYHDFVTKDALGIELYRIFSERAAPAPHH
jgi:uncharacterized protein (DUF2336 family)